MIVNINYKAFTTKSAVQDLDFLQNKPQHFIYKGNGFKILIFRSGKCRIMGCKKPITEALPYDIKIERLQSVTLSCDLGYKVNLLKLAAIMGDDCFYEPEIFPAIRYRKYNPLCVNIFATGKVVILGVKTLEYQQVEQSIIADITILLLDEIFIQ